MDVFERGPGSDKEISGLAACGYTEGAMAPEAVAPDHTFVCALLLIPVRATCLSLSWIARCLEWQELRSGEALSVFILLLTMFQQTISLGLVSPYGSQWTRQTGSHLMATRPAHARSTLSGNSHEQVWYVTYSTTRHPACRPSSAGVGKEQSGISWSVSG